MKKKTVLFQGDSITDVNRIRENSAHLGCGYPNLAASAIAYEEPEKYVFINRAISGDRIIDLQARIKRDIINLEPDIMSILIGVNDVWHEIADKNGLSTAKFELMYDMLIDEVKTAVPQIKLMILEPFVLKGEATEKNWIEFRGDTAEKAEAARRIAKKYDILFIPLQEKFNEAAKNISPAYWLYDGVHPTIAGHELIKREWLKAFRSISLS